MFLALAIIMFTAFEKKDVDGFSRAKKLTYKGETVYFANTICIYCLTAPPEYGYTCDLKKIDFENFNDVKDISEVYNSCSKKYTE